MTEEEEARLMRWVMEDSMATSGDVAIPEQDLDFKEEVLEEPPVAAWNPCLVGQRWSWACMAPEMAGSVGVVPWSDTPPRSPEQEHEPREEVVQVPPAPPVWQGPSTLLCQPPPYVDLTSNNDQ
ncbi:hypothetical protein VPH35_136755 [Triticum aestivum]